MLKRVLVMIVIVVITTILLPSSVASEPSAANGSVINDITVDLNGRYIKGVGAYIKNGRVLIPIRILLEEIETNFTYEDTTKTVRIYKYSSEMVLKVGEKVAYFNGTPIQMDVPAEISNGKICIPLRFVIEALRGQANWIDEDKVARIRISDIAFRNLSANFLNIDVYTKNKLKVFNGRYGMPSYIAIDGLVYDVSSDPEWGDGEFYKFEAGRDMTFELKRMMPFEYEKFKQYEIVGKYIGDEMGNS